MVSTVMVWKTVGLDGCVHAYKLATLSTQSQSCFMTMGIEEAYILWLWLWLEYAQGFTCIVRAGVPTEFEARAGSTSRVKPGMPFSFILHTGG